MAVAKLTIKDGADSGRQFDLEEATTIGRDGDLEVPLEDAEVSRRHAVLKVGHATATIEDLGSSNGTFVNGDRIAAERTLASGDRIRVGQTTFEFRSLGQPTKLSNQPPVAGPEGTAFTQRPDFAGDPVAGDRARPSLPVTPPGGSPAAVRWPHSPEPPPSFEPSPPTADPRGAPRPQSHGPRAVYGTVHGPRAQQPAPSDGSIRGSIESAKARVAPSLESARARVGPSLENAKQATAGLQVSRSVAIALTVLGILALVIGVAGLSILSEYKPTAENLLFRSEDVLSPDAYKTAKTVCLLVLTGGGLSLAAGLVVLLIGAQKRQ